MLECCQAYGLNGKVPDRNEAFYTSSSLGFQFSTDQAITTVSIQAAAFLASPYGVTPTAVDTPSGVVNGYRCCMQHIFSFRKSDFFHRDAASTVVADQPGAHVILLKKL